MTGLETLSIVLVAIWLVILSLVVTLTVRQIALMTARVDNLVSLGIGTPRTTEDEGPRVGSRIDGFVAQTIPDVLSSTTHLLLLSANCAPCREFAGNLNQGHLPNDSRVVALVPGRPELATSLAQMLPPSVKVVTDPDATDIAKLLNMQLVPSAVAIKLGTVSAKIGVLDSVERFVEFTKRTNEIFELNGNETLAVKGAEYVA